MGAVYLIRHGQASFGSANYDQLSPVGRQQADYFGRYLANKGLGIDYWFSGTLERQKDTLHLARTAFADVVGVPIDDLTPLQRHAGFNEFDFAEVTATILPLLDKDDPDVSAFVNAKEDRLQFYQPVFEKVIERWLTQNYWEGIESWPQFSARVVQAFEQAIDYAGTGKNSVIVSSGGPISALVSMALSLTPAAAISLNWTIANTSMSKIFYMGKRRSVGYFNNYSYLQQAADRRLVTFR